MSITLLERIKAPKSEVFRRCLIKRRSATTGLFESSWYDISSYVKSYGNVSQKIDYERQNKFTFSNAKITVNNDNGIFNPSTEENSLWFGYLNQQRTLVKIEAGYKYRIQRTDGVWLNQEYPAKTLWDVNFWDVDNSVWEGETSAIVFIGIISGDVVLSDKNDVVFNLKPLTSIFEDYPANQLTGYTSTGRTASQFATMLRDQTDGSGNYVFRPFFDNTSTNFDISTTTNVFTALNTNTSGLIYDKSSWYVLEQLAGVENFVPYINREGVFKFVSRTPNTTTAQFEFHGVGSYSGLYGHTIKEINSFGFRISKYYSQVSVKYVDSDTYTSYEVVSASMTVSPSSNPWVLGFRVLKIENFLIPNSTMANSIATALFNDYSTVKNEIEFTTSFIPHLDILDRISISYDASGFNINSLWDQKNWASDDTSTADDLIFDNSSGDAIKLNNEEFKFLSIELDINNFQNKFIAREL